ncbi:hypothetical protein HMI54_011197 [Coelomomyces lativittatus]|nr:hypothetical protein HMI54_011197 [Coelomomyces lativittatus]
MAKLSGTSTRAKATSILLIKSSALTAPFSYILSPENSKPPSDSWATLVLSSSTSVHR